jgi:hypothetical protein
VTIRNNAKKSFYDVFARQKVAFISEIKKTTKNVPFIQKKSFVFVAKPALSRYKDEKRCNG